MRSASRPAKTGTRRRRSVQEVLSVAAIGVTLGFAAFAADGYLAAAKRHSAAAEAAQDDEEIYTGSILYMPDASNVCHQWLFDNHNGQFSDNGYVDCERAFYQGSPDSPKQWSAARVRVISTGFRGE